MMDDCTIESCDRSSWSECYRCLKKDIAQLKEEKSQLIDDMTNKFMEELDNIRNKNKNTEYTQYLEKIHGDALEYLKEILHDVKLGWFDAIMNADKLKKLAYLKVILNGDA
jgi:hypothetical protein